MKRLLFSLVFICAAFVCVSAQNANVAEARLFCVDAGSTDAYACNLKPSIPGYRTGTHYRFKANTANTGAATVNFNSRGAKTIKKVTGGITTDLSDNDIRVGQWVDLVYDGTNMQMQSMPGTAPGGGPTGPAGNALDGTYPNPGLAAGVAGNGLAESSDVLSVNVDGSTIEINSDSLRVKDGGITYAKIQNLSAASKLLGRGDSGSGSPQEITLGSGLSISGTTISATGSGGTVTPSSSDTFTNKTIDAEGTGNSVTIPFTIWFAAAGCSNTTAASFWDLPTSTPAVAACVTGTNTQKGVLQFADTSGGFSAQTAFLLPADWSGNVDAKIIWKTSATSGNAKFSLSTICTAVGATETDDPSFNTASTVTTAAAGTANRLQTSSISSLIVTGCAAGEFLHLKLFRDGNDGSDTLSAALDVIGVEITIRRAM